MCGKWVRVPFIRIWHCIYIRLSLLAVGGIQVWLEYPLVTSLGGFNEVIWYPLQRLYFLHSLACNGFSLNVCLMVLSFIQCGLMWMNGFIWFISCPSILWTSLRVMTILGIQRVILWRLWLYDSVPFCIYCNMIALCVSWPCVTLWSGWHFFQGNSWVSCGFYFSRELFKLLLLIFHSTLLCLTFFLLWAWFPYFLRYGLFSLFPFREKLFSPLSD